MQNRILTKILLGMICVTSGCSVLAIRSENEGEHAPIENPFSDFYGSPEKNQSTVLRTKKGDRSFELEIPEKERAGTDFIIPLNPKFKDTNPYDLAGEDMGPDSYKQFKPSVADREITSSFPKGKPEDDWKRQEIEANLGLVPSDDQNLEHNSSYLAGVDYAKRLFKSGRLEATILHIDQMLRTYPTDPKLHEMRGTILGRLGYQELAIKSWNQALEFNPGNTNLRKFLEKKNMIQQARRPAGQ